LASPLTARSGAQAPGAAAGSMAAGALGARPRTARSAPGSVAATLSFGRSGGSAEPARGGGVRATPAGARLLLRGPRSSGSRGRSGWRRQSPRRCMAPSQLRLGDLNVETPGLGMWIGGVAHPSAPCLPATLFFFPKRRHTPRAWTPGGPLLREAETPLPAPLPVGGTLRCGVQLPPVGGPRFPSPEEPVVSLGKRAVGGRGAWT
jgi:hypothetical protein